MIIGINEFSVENLLINKKEKELINFKTSIR